MATTGVDRSAASAGLWCIIVRVIDDTTTRAEVAPPGSDTMEGMNTRPTPPEFAMCDINIQWKNTDLCIDFHCSCTPDDQKFAGHFDGYFGNHLECPNCGARYVLPQGFSLRAINESGFHAEIHWQRIDMDADHG